MSEPTLLPQEIGKHYKFSFAGHKIDPYRIFKIYNITDPAQQHSIKKLLRAGQSVKSLRQDIAEVIVTLQRWVEMMDEDDKLNFASMIASAPTTQCQVGVTVGVSNEAYPEKLGTFMPYAIDRTPDSFTLTRSSEQPREVPKL